MFTQKLQKGQALALIAVAIVALIAVTALAIDASNVFADRRDAQSAADNAALSGALALAKGYSVTNSALNVTTLNGYATSQVTVSNPPTTGCGGVASPYANVTNKANYVLVVIQTTTTTTFGPIVGIKTVSSCVEATSYATTGNGGPMYGGYGLVALNPTANPGCLLNSSATINVTGAGFFCNGSLMLNSSARINTTGGGTTQVHGTVTINSGGSISPSYNAGVTALPYPPDMSSMPTIPVPPVSCPTGTAATKVGNTYSPGDLTSQNFSSATYTFNPGNYCFVSGNNINSSAIINGPSGKVVFILGDQNLPVGSSSSLNFNNLEIYSNNGFLTLNSSATATATRFRFIATGSGAITVNSSGSLTSSNAFIYSKTGTFNWNSSATINLTAPPDGDPDGLAGLVIYLPLTNTSSFILNSSATLTLKGTFLAPAVALTLNSSGGASNDRQIIVNTVTINSSAVVTLNYNASAFFDAPGNPTVELVK